MTDEEFVRANWVHVGEGVITVYLGDCESGSYCATLPGWSAAAEFTRERLEQIRQLRAEIRMVNRQLSCQPNAIEVMDYSAPDVRLSQTNVARWSRILARLESALADLKRGMRTAAPEGAIRHSND